MATLTILNGPNAGHVCQLTRASMVFGRHSDCDILLRNQLVSRLHAKIFCRGDEFFIEDLSSANGTFVNGKEVEAPERLNDRDWIEINHVIFEFYDERTEASSDSANAKDKRPVAGGAGRDTALNKQPSLDWVVHASPQVRLQAVLQITRDLGASLDTDHITEHVVEGALRAFPYADKALLLEIDELTGNFVPVASHERRCIGDSTLSGGVAEPALLRRAARERKVVASGWQDGAKPRDSVIEHRDASCLCAPLIGPTKEMLGVLYIEVRQRGRAFCQEDFDLLTCFAILAAGAISYTQTHARRYRAVVESAADAIITCNDQGEIESVNSSGERMFGYRPRKLIGCNIAALFAHPDVQGDIDWRRFLTRQCASERGRPARGEILGRRKEGGLFPLELSVAEFALDGQKRFTIICQDITTRKQVEKEIHESRQQLEALNSTLEKRVAERTRYVCMLQDAAVIANEADSLEEVFEKAVENICGHMNWPAGRAFLIDSQNDPEMFGQVGEWFWRLSAPSPAPGAIVRSGDGLVGLAIASGAPTWINDVCRQDSAQATTAPLPFGLPRSGTALAFPIRVGDRVWGALEFFTSTEEEPCGALLQVMSLIGAQLSRAVERRQLQKELVDAVWRQQCQFGQEIHDGLGQELTGIRMMAETLYAKLSSKSLPEAEAAAELTQLIQQTQAGVRRLAKGLFPVEVFEQGLMAALAELAAGVTARCGVTCRFHYEEPIEVQDHELATHLFRIAQEAVNNAVRHSHGDRIDIVLRENATELTLEVTDNGVGVPTSGSPGSPGQRTRVRCTVAPRWKDEHVKSQPERPVAHCG